MLKVETIELSHFFKPEMSNRRSDKVTLAKIGMRLQVPTTYDDTKLNTFSVYYRIFNISNILLTEVLYYKVYIGMRPRYAT